MHPKKLHTVHVLHVCASSCMNVHISKNSKKLKIQSTINGKLICINGFTLKLIFCNCFAVIYIIILNVVNAQKICSLNPTLRLADVEKK